MGQESSLKMRLSQIAGVDEAGRGPLAGPVVAAAVILPDDFPTSGLKDSKILRVKERNYFAALIRARAITYATAMIGSREIDELNIFQATLKAMAMAVNQLLVIPEKILVDGNRTIPELNLPQEALIKGDTFHPAIICAGILAKVTRDRWMLQMHRKYPHYGFRSHKGYGTSSHLKALRAHGPCAIHRFSFTPVRELTT